jgi:hypothetical protein
MAIFLAKILVCVEKIFFRWKKMEKIYLENKTLHTMCIHFLPI